MRPSNPCWAQAPKKCCSFTTILEDGGRIEINKKGHFYVHSNEDLQESRTLSWGKFGIEKAWELASARAVPAKKSKPAEPVETKEQKKPAEPVETEELG